jgi:uncharacterized protein YkwD
VKRSVGALLLLLAAGRLPAADLMTLPDAEFAALPGLQGKINPTELDKDLLSAAIFHATNRVRVQFNLPGFEPLPKLNEAADIQATIGGVLIPPAHTNPFSAFATPLDRIKFVGLHPDRLAENIALLPAYDIDLALDVGVKMEGPKRTFINPATGAVLDHATYGQFAETAVAAWMGSPGHRRNILDPKLKFLGCSVRWVRSVYGADMIFGVQEFYTPEPKKKKKQPTTPIMDQPQVLSPVTIQRGTSR